MGKLWVLMVGLLACFGFAGASMHFHLSAHGAPENPPVQPAWLQQQETQAVNEFQIDAPRAVGTPHFWLFFFMHAFFFLFVWGLATEDGSLSASTDVVEALNTAPNEHQTPASLDSPTTGERGAEPPPKSMRTVR